MTDELLDSKTHDIALVNGDTAIVSGIDQITQNIKITLLMVRGEYFGNPNLGTIDFDMLRDKAQKGTIDAIIKANIVDTPEVVSLDSYSSTQNGRCLMVSFTATTIYGQLAVNSLELLP